MPTPVALRSSPSAPRAGAPRCGEDVRRFLVLKARGLKSRAHRLASLTPRDLGYSPQDLSYAPSAGHFQAANERLAAIDRAVRKRLA